MLINPKEVALLKVRNWIIGIVVFLALFGLGSRLIYEPVKLLTDFLFMALIIGFIFFVFMLIMRRRPGYHERKAFVKAARLSKKRKKTAEWGQSTPPTKKPIRRRSTAHLTVIEGKKGKKKNRAIF